MADPMYVEVGSGLEDFRLIYTAATDLVDVDLKIVVPDELLPLVDSARGLGLNMRCSPLTRTPTPILWFPSSGFLGEGVTFGPLMGIRRS